MRARRSPSSAHCSSRVFRAETIAISDMANTPFSTINRRTTRSSDVNDRHRSICLFRREHQDEAHDANGCRRRL